MTLASAAVASTVHCKTLFILEGIRAVLVETHIFWRVTTCH